MEGASWCARTKPYYHAEAWCLSPVKVNWKRRAEIIDYCVKVVDEAQVGHQSDHRAGVDDDGVARRPSSSSPLSVGVADETKVSYS
jgi:hypothetical protein